MLPYTVFTLCMRMVMDPMSMPGRQYFCHVYGWGEPLRVVLEKRNGTPKVERAIWLVCCGLPALFSVKREREAWKDRK
ncbi:hypothetical protein AA0481_2220 [Acetobacter orientalis NRIC 0481]|uniref:Uncharacterized protein n=1 Tax=Acetobacter orientalis TaxID=146474 RepID=A0A0D6NN37_9PROT|nr:hypothetical protein Abor_026_024 [Acetobacter orientalis]GBR20820.1 hypothetical protein AA0481_2220 [Acetobacter orientalis NRIC 0481]GEL60553.1 hypothetical protein AOR02nite_03950 [Acetobacter orientalis]